MMRLRHRVLVGPQNDLGLLIVDMKGSKAKDKTRKRRVRRKLLEPIVVEVG
jgi:hypothetical protein